MNRERTRLVIVEDELLVSGMLRNWFRRFPDLELVGCAADGEAGLEFLASLELRRDGLVSWERLVKGGRQ